MMRRERLLQERRIVKKMSYYATNDMVYTLIDSHLEALDEIDRLRAARKWFNWSDVKSKLVEHRKPE